jgi:hypothetical protein
MDQMLPRPATSDEALLMQQNTMLFQENCVWLQNEQALYAAWKIQSKKTISLLSLKHSRLKHTSCVAKLRPHKEKCTGSTAGACQHRLLHRRRTRERDGVDCATQDKH